MEFNTAIAVLVGLVTRIRKRVSEKEYITTLYFGDDRRTFEREAPRQINDGFDRIRDQLAGEDK